MDTGNVICKITASVLFLTAGIVYTVMSGRDNNAVRLNVRNEYAMNAVSGENIESEGYSAEVNSPGGSNETGKTLSEDKSGDSVYNEDSVSEDRYTATGITEVLDDRIDINTADAELLMTLPGIGAVKAEAIISYRNENGYFKVPEDLMLVPGIKEGTYGKLKDRIVCNRTQE